MMINVYRVYHDDAHNHCTVRAETREDAEVIGAIVFGVSPEEIIARYVITEAKEAMSEETKYTPGLGNGIGERMRDGDAAINKALAHSK